MPLFDTKRVPTGFGFPLTKRAIKAGLGETIDLFRTIKISGISSSESASSSFLQRYWSGILTASKAEDGWFFDLRIEALRNENLQLHKEHIAALLIGDINDFVEEKLALPATSSPEPRQLFLCYSIEGSTVVSMSHKVIKDK